MPVHYWVNSHAQSNGDHEVHKYGCNRMPDKKNLVDLGFHYSDYSALEAARKLYPKADGCWYCCPTIHNS